MNFLCLNTSQFILRLRAMSDPLRELDNYARKDVLGALTIVLSVYSNIFVEETREQHKNALVKFVSRNKGHLALDLLKKGLYDKEQEAREYVKYKIQEFSSL